MNFMLRSGFQLCALTLLLHQASGTLNGETPTDETGSYGTVEISGELRRWHNVTLTLDGPTAAEDGTPNPFLDYRMQVEFHHTESGLTYLVPGYFAADGDAANSSASVGNKWRAHLAPDHVGRWNYRISFRQGENVAVSDEVEAGEAIGELDGLQGSFEIIETNKQGRDHRARGRLEYVGKHHLRFAGSGEYFLKAGVDAPENFLAYQDFDGDFKTDGQNDRFIKDWAPHERDWQEGDPVWQADKGKGMIGAINYLAAQGLNAFSFLTLNIDGDDRNAFPYISYDERERIDCSRMDQWEIVFSHGTQLGMYLHFKTQEAENVNLLDQGQLGLHRKLYYRELIARFSHHLALNWNLGEEVGLGFEVSTRQKQDWANYFWTHDPYRHHIVIHNGNSHFDLLGEASALTGFSLQTNQADFSRVHNRTKEYLRRSVAAGKPWVVACDEPGDASHSLITDEEDPTRDNPRMNALWGHLMAGGAGVEWYFGYQHPHSDLTCQDFRVRQKMWEQSRIALEFFAAHQIPFWEMQNADQLLGDSESYCLCKPHELYLVYVKSAGNTRLDLSAEEGLFEVIWFNPRAGGMLSTGSHHVVQGGGTVDIGQPHALDGPDWLAIVRPGDPSRDYPPNVSATSVAQVELPRNKEFVEVQLTGSVNDDRTVAENLVSQWTMISGPSEVSFQNAESPVTMVCFPEAGEYLLRLSAHDGEQAASATVKITVTPYQSVVTRQIPPSEDAYLEGERGFQDQHLKVEGNRRISLLKFDLSTLPANVTGLQLQLTESGDPGAGTLRVYQGSDSDWAADALSKQTLPEPGNLLAERAIQVSANQQVTIELSLLPETRQMCTLMLILDEGGNDIWFGSSRSQHPPRLLARIETQDGTDNAAESGEAMTPGQATAETQQANSFDFKYDPKTAEKVHVQTAAAIVVEAEDFDATDRNQHRHWYLTTADSTPDVEPDPDPNHAGGAVGEAYLEILPDTRVTHDDPLVHGVSFAPAGGQCSVLYYPIEFTEAGRYYVWARICCSGTEDNGLHVGLDGEWPASGQRMQWTGKHGQWQWDSRQRTAEVHTGVLGQIWLDIDEPGLHTVMFSMREDGFEFDRFMLTLTPQAMESKNSEPGPEASPRR